MLRANVRGDRGPKRSELPNFKLLCPIPPQLLAELNFVIDNSAPDHNDLYGEEYAISQTCPLRYEFPQSYRQILLQKPEATTTGEKENDYRVPTQQKAYDLLREVIPNFYRARLAVLMPGQVINWHIDTDTSVSCRVAATIRGRSRWSIRRRDGVIEEMDLEPGGLWFTNTGWPHRVENLDQEPRWCLLMGTSYDDIAAYF